MSSVSLAKELINSSYLFLSYFRLERHHDLRSSLQNQFDASLHDLPVAVVLALRTLIGVHGVLSGSHGSGVILFALLLLLLKTIQIMIILKEILFSSRVLSAA